MVSITIDGNDDDTDGNKNENNNRVRSGECLTKVVVIEQIRRTPRLCHIH